MFDFPEPFGPTDHGDAGFELKARSISKRLEPNHFQGLQIQVTPVSFLASQHISPKNRISRGQGAPRVTGIRTPSIHPPLHDSRLDPEKPQGVTRELPDRRQVGLTRILCRTQDVIDVVTRESVMKTDYRFFGWLNRHARVVVLGVVVAALALGAFAPIVADGDDPNFDPAGTIFNVNARAMDTLNSESSISGAGFLVESADGDDVLTAATLREWDAAATAVRNDPDHASHLVTTFDADLGTEVPGVLSIVDIVDDELDGGLSERHRHRGQRGPQRHPGRRLAHGRHAIHPLGASHP